MATSAPASSSVRRLGAVDGRALRRAIRHVTSSAAPTTRGPATLHDRDHGAAMGPEERPVTTAERGAEGRGDERGARRSPGHRRGRDRPRPPGDDCSERPHDARRGRGGGRERRATRARRPGSGVPCTGSRARSRVVRGRGEGWSRRSHPWRPPRAPTRRSVPRGRPAATTAIAHGVQAAAGARRQPGWPGQRSPAGRPPRPPTSSPRADRPPRGGRPRAAASRHVRSPKGRSRRRPPGRGSPRPRRTPSGTRRP